MKPKSISISRRFNPGHASHLLASQSLLAEAGFNSMIVWHSDFDRLFPEDKQRHKAWSARPISLKRNDVAIIWFPSIRAVLDALIIRVMTRARLVYVLHEPLDTIQSYIKGGLNRREILRALLISGVNRSLTALSHKVILPSRRAWNAMPLAQTNPNKFSCFPLIFRDEAVNAIDPHSRKYFSYIGTIAQDHAFDEFFRFVSENQSHLAALNLKVLVATRSVVSDAHLSTLKQIYPEGDIRIIHGAPLSNLQINSCYEESAIVWNAYKRSMQSGVLPKAYMFGAPVLITNLNRSEFFSHLETGVEISASYDAEEMKLATSTIMNNINDYSSAARSVFLRDFHYRAHMPGILKFISS
jgi:hypothetical protein